MNWKMAAASFALTVAGRALLHYGCDAFFIGAAYGVGGVCAAFAWRGHHA